MGISAEIYIFDYKKYQEECVPEFLNLLCGIENKPWFEEFLCNKFSKYFESFKTYIKQHPTNILENCEIFTENLEYIGYFYKDKIYSNNYVYENFSEIYSGESSNCKSKTCIEALLNCPFHTNQNNKIQFPKEEFNYMFQGVIENFYIGESQFVGKSMTPLRFEEFFEETEIDSFVKEEIRNYLYLLGSRGNIVGRANWGGSDGIHGWLNYNETLNFTKVLKKINIPEFEPTIENIKKIDYANNYEYQHQWFSEIPERFAKLIIKNYDWSYILLSYLRAFGEIALKTGKGILWGNGLNID
jgi:hypothetical protein